MDHRPGIYTQAATPSATVAMAPVSSCPAAANSPPASATADTASPPHKDGTHEQLDGSGYINTDVDQHVGRNRSIGPPGPRGARHIPQLFNSPPAMPVRTPPR